MKRFVLLLLFFLLVGCSAKQKPEAAGNAPAPIDISNNLEKCLIHKDYVSCTLTSGYSYYASMEKINQVAVYDKTMWKENVGGNLT
jgi:hypothetical protein